MTPAKDIELENAVLRALICEALDCVDAHRHFGPDLTGRMKEAVRMPNIQPEPSANPLPTASDQGSNIGRGSM